MSREVQERNAIPSGELFPNGILPSRVPAEVQATTMIPGSFFQPSSGFAGIRAGKNRFQDASRGWGYHFAPLLYAEDVGRSGHSLLVDPTSVEDDADVAELIGSGDLDVQEMDVKLATPREPETAPDSVAERHRATLDLTGVRSIPGVLMDETRRIEVAGRNIWHNPVKFISNEYQRTPLKAILLAAVITGGVYVVVRDFERSYRRRARRGVLGAAPAATVETTGSTAETIIETPVKAVAKVAQAAGDAVEGVTETVAEAIS